MTKRYLAALAITVLGTIASTHASAAVYASATIDRIIQASGDTCYYFRLVGVGTADSTVSASPLFAISREDRAAKDMLAVLITSKMSGRTVTVDTVPNQAICGGFARANGVVLD